MVSRRLFIGASASLLLAPLLKIQPVIDRHALLMMFTDKDYVRYDLSRPYYLSGHAYATCGRTMARIVSDESEVLDESIKIPPIERVWADCYRPATQWQRFELHDIADLVPPNVTWLGECPECDDRWVDAPDGYIRETINDPAYDPDTHEIRDVSCPLCHGRNWTGPCFQRVGSQLIKYQYAKRLAKVPSCEVAIGEPYDYSHPTYGPLIPVLFRSDLMSGIVCTIDQSKLKDMQD